MTRLYLGWALRISISTTIVFCILVETTRPTFSLRREACASCAAAVLVAAVAVLVVSAMIYAFFAFLRAVRVLAAGALATATGDAALSAESVRSRAMVWMRAMSSLSTRSFLMPSLLPRLFWKRKRKSCSADLACWLLSSSSVRLRIFSSSIIFPSLLNLCNPLLGGDSCLDVMALNEDGLQRQLVGCEAHGFLGKLGRNAFHLEQNLARANDSDPVIGSALTFTHTSFGRLLGDGLVRKDAQPYLAAALDEASHGDTAGFDLAVGDVAAFLHLQTEIAEREIRTAPGLATHASALLLAEFDLLWHQHKRNPLTLDCWSRLRTQRLKLTTNN